MCCGTDSSAAAAQAPVHAHACRHEDGQVRSRVYRRVRRHVFVAAGSPATASSECVHACAEAAAGGGEWRRVVLVLVVKNSLCAHACGMRVRRGIMGPKVLWWGKMFLRVKAV